MKHFFTNLANCGFSVRTTENPDEYWIFIGESEDIPKDKFYEFCVLKLAVTVDQVGRRGMAAKIGTCLPTYGLNVYNDNLIKCIDICESSFPKYEFLRRNKAEVLVDMSKKYFTILAKMGVIPKKIEQHTIVPVRYWQFRHIMWMCEQCADFVKNNKLAKAERWLGFVQGVLWSHEIRSVEQLRADNVE